MKKFLIYLTLFSVFICSVTDVLARRSHISPEQKAALSKIQTIYLNVLALTEDGRVDPTPLTAVIVPQLTQLGYNVVTDRTQPHDVVFRVKCEERKRWTGTTRSGGDAELADAPARLWTGPACLFSYRLQGKDLGWYKEVRTTFADATKAAQEANVPNPGQYALSRLQERLKTFDFPVLITSEWGQTDRLVNLLTDPSTPSERKINILTILSEVSADEALPHLIDMVKSGKHVEEAIAALSGIGSPAIPYLIDFFQNSSSDTIRAAAAKGLGHIGALTGDPSITPPLLDYLNDALTHMEKSSDINFPVLTEVVIAIYKLRNEKSIRPIEILNEKIWMIHDNSPEMKRLREEANVATKMVDLDYQIM